MTIPQQIFIAPYAQGVGDSDRFAQATGLDYVEESSVGEFVLGSLPPREVKTSGVESVEVDEAQVPLVREALSNFLHRVYNDLRNVGKTSRDRALNFAATNIFQAAATFAQAIAQDRQLDIITVEKSPFCRLNSDCWDIRLEFYDPDSSRRGRKVFCFTIDVALIMPVTIGEIKSWSLPSRSKES
ncbi:putative peptidase PatA homolog [Tolypothrix tenuis PCC 7101]|uniref:Putative peptidase PatA homolog n=1 Tax=Tolypothrix tenuis PCC 7101 TaxID=231146 RepID=A0A1Z4N106_9CYAN|nr:hypothetical protein [Aulosira sp. FACHB-113]BAY99393.1 putative peptidase PatA homolog [Tolypothrix tenuis PCC 7101]BAZ76686.1 putative peptidase PatA homolog [Aulosira laxa NIES-50]